jgi:transposase
MKMFVEPGAVYLHREGVDFRKSINGLVAIVGQEMNRSPFADALFVFCNRARDKLKIVYWDQTGFCLWYKRLEQERFNPYLSACSIKLVKKIRITAYYEFLN